MNDARLLLPFDTNDPAFVRGFEAGRVWNIVGYAIAAEELPTDALIVHAENAEMMLRIAEALDLSVRSTDLEAWIEVVFGAANSHARPGDAE